MFDNMANNSSLGIECGCIHHVQHYLLVCGPQPLLLRVSQAQGWGIITVLINISLFLVLTWVTWTRTRGKNKDMLFLKGQDKYNLYAPY